MRDEFSDEVKRILAARVGYRCSNPNCKKLTSGPGLENERALNIGVAAHITAASPGGPRYDESLNSQQRSSIENAIWLCQNCGALIDRDVERFTINTIRDWKLKAENLAASEIAAGGEFRSISPNELRQELTIGEMAAIRALSDEFKCGIETNVSVSAGSGWLNLHAAVVRGEDLVAIEIHEIDDEHGVAYYQIEYLIELGSSLKFERFQSFVLYIVVVSTASPDVDAKVNERIEKLVKSANCEVHFRFYRLNSLRAKYTL